MKTYRFEILPTKEQKRMLSEWASDCKRMLNYISKAEYGAFKKSNSQENVGKKYATKDSDKSLSKLIDKDYKMRHLYGVLDKFRASIKPPQYDRPFIVSTSQISKVTKEEGAYYFSYRSPVNKKVAHTVPINPVDKKGRDRGAILDVFVKKEGGFTFEIHKALGKGRNKNRFTRWILHLIDSSPIYQPKGDYSTVMGIDMGINRPAVVLVRNKDGGLIWRKFYKEKLKKRSKNYTENYLHNISKEIVDKAKELDSVIAIESLDFRTRKKRTGPGKGDRGEIIKRRNLSKWAYGELSRMIKYKAEHMGVIVQEVNPAKTSMLCPKCKEENKFDREVEKRFVCEDCKGDYDFDFVGAWNISNKLLIDLKA